MELLKNTDHFYQHKYFLICYNWQNSATNRKTMEKKFKAVIFDMGGVLLRSVDSAPRAAIARRFGTTRAGLEGFVFQGPTSIQSERGEVSDIHTSGKPSLRHFGHREEDPQEIYAEFFSGDAIDQELLTLAHP